jgi:hypothetical protein
VCQCHRESGVHRSLHCINGKHRECTADFFSASTCRCDCHPTLAQMEEAIEANTQSVPDWRTQQWLDANPISADELRKAMAAARPQASPMLRQIDKDAELDARIRTQRWHREGRNPTALEMHAFVYGLPEDLALVWFERALEGCEEAYQCRLHDHVGKIEHLTTVVRQSRLIPRPKKRRTT